MSFNRSGYIGRAPGDSAITIARKSYEPTGVQTDFTFSAGYVNGYCDVYLNGVKLINEKDYTATNGSTVGLNTASNSGDVVEIIAYKAFNLGVPLSDITGDLSITGSVSASSSITADNGVYGTFYGSGSNLTGVASTDYIITGTAATFNSQVKVLNLNVTGITSTTSFNVGTATTIDGGGINVTGVVTATSFSGSGANLTGLATTETIRTDTLTVAGVSTFTGALNATSVVSSGAVSGTTGTFSGAVNVDATTDSTSSTSGALIVDGGVGIAKNVYIGAGLSVAGTLTYEDVTNVDSVGLITAKSGVNITGGQLTVGSGITMGIAGVATFSGTSDVHLHDNVRLNVGDGSDLAIYHDGSHSYIADSGTGDLKIQTNTLQLLNAAGNEYYLLGVENAQTQLYYNNSKKWETTNDGTVTTGIATVDALRLGDNEYISVGVGGTGDLQISHNGTDSFIQNNTGNFQINANEFRLRTVTGETIAQASINGEVQLWYDNSERIRTTSLGAKISSNQSAGYLEVSTTASSGDGHIEVIGGEGGSAVLSFTADEGDDNLDYWRIQNGGDGLLGFRSKSSGSFVEKMQINDNGVTVTGTVSDSKGDVRSIPLNQKTGAYVLLASDAGKAIYISTGGVTINNSLFSAGDAVTIINNSGSTQTITQGSGVTLYDTGDDGSTGNKTLKARGMATVYFSGASVGYISGNF